MACQCRLFCGIHAVWEVDSDGLGVNKHTLQVHTPNTNWLSPDPHLFFVGLDVLLKMWIILHKIIRWQWKEKCQSGTARLRSSQAKERKLFPTAERNVSCCRIRESSQYVKCVKDTSASANPIAKGSVRQSSGPISGVTKTWKEEQKNCTMKMDAQRSLPATAKRSSGLPPQDRRNPKAKISTRQPIE